MPGVPAVDRNKVHDGDQITYTGLHRGEITATVIYAVADGVLVSTPGGQYKIGWDRVTSHTPRSSR
jgi:hypothetical protein